MNNSLPLERESVKVRQSQHQTGSVEFGQSAYLVVEARIAKDSFEMNWFEQMVLVI